MIDSRGVVVALQTIAAAARRGLVFGAEAVTFHVMRQLLPSGAARYDTYKQHSWTPGHVYYRRVFGLSLPVALLMSPGPTLSLTDSLLLPFCTWCGPAWPACVYYNNMMHVRMTGKKLAPSVQLPIAAAPSIAALPPVAGSEPAAHCSSGRHTTPMLDLDRRLPHTTTVMVTTTLTELFQEGVVAVVMGTAWAYCTEQRQSSASRRPSLLNSPAHHHLYLVSVEQLSPCYLYIHGNYGLFA